MLQEFAESKIRNYQLLVEFHAGRISRENLLSSELPPYILNFFRNYTTNENYPLNKNLFDDILRKAVIFNINHIIKPCNTILKFLFGEVESRQSDFIAHRLSYFEFYGYYTETILRLTTSESIITRETIEELLSNINSKIYEEISSDDGKNSRGNLIKLLFYFFCESGQTKNLLIPTKVLSDFLKDKGFNELAEKADSFFSREIYFQEAVELINPLKKKPPPAESSVDITEEEVIEIVKKAKADLMNQESSDKDIGKTFVKNFKEKSEPFIKNKNQYVSENYSEELIFAAKLNEISESINRQPEISDSEKKLKLINELFCEETYRKRIIKKIFSKNHDLFLKTVSDLINTENWNSAVKIIEKIFETAKVNYLSDEAVKFVDIMESYFENRR
ncbi:MAG: hypothetical protein N2510_04990 [Ignavibacteria bacterium]|nr:hypothetical protein [Ignavibacteria bacterium]